MALRNELLKGLKAAATAGDAQTLRRLVVEGLAAQGLAFLADIRRTEVLLLHRNKEGRRDLRDAYLEALLDSSVPADLLKDEAIYCSYCEVFADTRDKIAGDAATAAEGLHGLPFNKALELCVRVAASSIRRFIAEAKRAHDGDGSGAELKSTAYATDISHEIGGRFAVIAHMAKQLAQSSRGNAALPKRGIGGLVASGKQFFGLAEEWQTLSYLRQQVACGETDVQRVEQGDGGAHVFLAPRDLVELWRLPVVQRRLAFMSRASRVSEHALDRFPVDLPRMVEEVAKIVAPLEAGEELCSNALGHLRREISGGMTPVDMLLVVEAPREVAEFTLALWAAHLFANTANIIAAILLREQGMYGQRKPFVGVLDRANVLRIVAQCSRASDSKAKMALAEATSDAASTLPMDLSTRPFLSIGPDQVALIRSPFGNSHAFLECRRILAARNATSGYLGSAYERELRALLALGGFHVHDGRVILHEDGRQITDLDVLAYKDGIVFVIQAKCIAEPDSSHALWKARQQINNGIRQCLAARAFLRRRPETILSLLGRDVSGVYELCCAVVSPAVRFCGECAWPVGVVDDRYLNHVVTVGAIRGKDAEGRDIHRRLYPGPQPTGPELRDLLLSPAPLWTLHSGGGGILPGTRRIRDVTVASFFGSDGIGLHRGEDGSGDARTAGNF